MKTATYLKGTRFVAMSAGLALTAGLALIAEKPAIAQYAEPGDPLQENVFSGDRSSDPFAGTGGGQMSGALDLFHRANLGLTMDSMEFQRQQQESLNTEATNFRTIQLERLRDAQQQTAPETVSPVAPEPN